MKFKVINFENKAAGEIELDDTVFGLPVRKDLLNRMVNYQLAKRRQGTHKTKTVGENLGRVQNHLNKKVLVGRGEEVIVLPKCVEDKQHLDLRHVAMNTICPRK